MMHYDTYDNFKTYCIEERLKFILWPKRCHLTHKTLWLEYAYEQVAMYTGPGDPVYDYRYYDQNEFLIAKIRGEV